MSIDLQQQCPGIFNKILGINKDGSNTAIPELYAESKENKKDLATKLGLLDEYKVECLESTFDISKYPKCLELVGLLVKEDITPSDVCKNKTPSGAKISRIVCKCEPKDIPSALRLMSALGSALEELNIDYSADDFIGSVDSLKKVVSEFAAKFWEVIAAESEIISGFSLDFLDILNAANSTSFTSCFSAEGSNSAGPLQVARYPLSGVIYVRQSNNNITGRCWVVFNKDCSAFSVLRRYGNLTSGMMHTLSKWICSKLDPAGNWVRNSSRWRLSVGPNLYGWYEDPIEGMYINLNSKRKITPNPTITMPDRVKCLSCGSELAFGTSGMLCATCRKATPPRVRVVPASGRTLEGYFVECGSCEQWYITDKPVLRCPKCMTGQVLCKRCGKKFARSDIQFNILASSEIRSSLMSTNRERDRYTDLCPECQKEYPCATCGAPVGDSGYPVCGSCLELFSKGVCEMCGETEQTYPASGHALCSGCLNIANDTNPLDPRKDVVESLIAEMHHE